jgi:O-antigen ligase
MPRIWYENILKFGVIISLVSFFILNRSLYFPYITGKQIYFNILVELMMVLWVAMVVKYPELRPKKSWITWSLVSFFGALLISSFFSIDFNLSFWGDAERMLGWFPTVHLFGLYLVLISVFRSREDWTWLFVASLAAASGLSLYAIFTATGNKAIGNVNMTSNISTLGNATYVAGVMIFNFFFGWYLFFQTRSRALKFVVLTAILLALIAFVYADVSGSQAGLAIGLLTTLVLAGALHKDSQRRKLTWIAVGALVLTLILLFSFRSASVFDGTRLGKILRDFNSNNATLRTRTYAWRAAYLGFKEYPILGNGYGNFAAHFDKYFIASYYQWSIGEEYFDRAHNNLLDILSTAGLLSLLSYLSIFVALFYYLIKGYREGKISILELSTMSGVLVGYFIHNLAVFDALANYILLFFSIGFVYYLYNREELEAVKADSKVDWTNQELQALVICGLVACGLIYNYSWQPAQVFAQSVRAASYWQMTNDPQKVFDMYVEAFKTDTPYNRDSKMLVASGINSNPDKLNYLSPAKRKEMLDYAIELLRENLVLNPKDSLTLLVLSRLETIAFNITRDVTYLQAALRDIDLAIAEGGEHIPPYILKANLLLMIGDKKNATLALEKAKSLYPAYPNLNCHLAKIGLSESKPSATTYELADSCLRETGGQESLGAGAFVESLIKRYREASDWELLVKVYELKVSQDLKNKALWLEIAELYKKLGDLERSEAVLEAMNQILNSSNK